MISGHPYLYASRAALAHKRVEQGLQRGESGKPLHMRSRVVGPTPWGEGRYLVH